MKKLCLIAICLLTLTACEDANKKIDEAQQAANDAIDVVQETLESFDINDLNLESFGDAARQASELALSIQQGIEGNLNDPEVFNNALDSVQNAYACMVDATSESRAEQFVNSLIDRINDPQVTDLIFGF